MPSVPLSGIDLELSTSFEDHRVVVGARGELDLLTTPLLAATLAALLAKGHADVAVDLGALDFIDAAGLGVLADFSSRLEASGGGLTLDSASAPVRRILQITGMDQLLADEVSDRIAHDALGSEQPTEDRASAGDGASVDRASGAARIGSKPVANGVADAALRLVTTLAAATIDGADGVSLSLHRQGRMSTAAATNHTVLLMDDHQYATGEGPCLAAASEGRWFHIDSLVEERRWPSFVPLAQREGIGSILSTPLLSADGPMGALNIYSNTAGAFDSHGQDLATLFAAQAAGILSAAATDEQFGARLVGGLEARSTIAQAQGVLMARHRMSAADATARLHRSARSVQITVLQYAAEIVEAAQNRSSGESSGDE